MYTNVFRRTPWQLWTSYHKNSILCVTLPPPSLMRSHCAQNACCHSAFYGILLGCCGDVSYLFALTSVFWIFFGHHENAALVWQRFKVWWQISLWHWVWWSFVSHSLCRNHVRYKKLYKKTYGNLQYIFNQEYR
jgi:hypothetical protein